MGGFNMSFRKSAAAVALSAAATVGLLAIPGQAAADPTVTAAAPGSVITYTRAQTKDIDRQFKENTSAAATINGAATVLCSAAGGAGGPAIATVCGAQGAFVAISLALLQDTAAEAARTNQCLKVDLAPNPRVESPPLPSITNGADCVD